MDEQSDWLQTERRHQGVNCKRTDQSAEGWGMGGEDGRRGARGVGRKEGDENVCCCFCFLVNGYHLVKFYCN